jgi:chromosome segregation ATPase
MFGPPLRYDTSVAGNQTANPLEGLLGDDNQDVEALERLESRVLDMVEQLRDARTRQLAAEKETARLREQLSEKERRLAELEARSDEGQNTRKAVRGRIESLLDRIEALEQG